MTNLEIKVAAPNLEEVKDKAIKIDAKNIATSFFAYIVNIFVITNWTPQEYLFSFSNIFWIGLISLLSFRKNKQTLVVNLVTT